MKRKRDVSDIFSLSFLDVVSCGFGAIVLLLLLMKLGEPTVGEDMQTVAATELSQLENTYSQVVDEASRLSQRIEQAKAIRQNLTDELQESKERLEQAKVVQDDVRRQNDSEQRRVSQLFAARQQLSEEVKRLQQPSAIPRDAPIGGIPVDSEYIIFVIDTSGSMQQFAWSAVRKKMAEILEIYPRVKGIQVMNDMGQFMFSQYSNRWIADTPARRQAILKRLAGWMVFSNSSPVEGVTAAIRRFSSADKKISLYIFGDDFSRGTIQEVVDTVNRVNLSPQGNLNRVRIHAVGFPTLFGQARAERNAARFAALMRRLAEDNQGSFVGLTSLR